MKVSHVDFGMNPAKYVIIGDGKYLLLQVLLALRAFTDDSCLVICAPGTRFLSRSTLISDYLEADFDGKDDDKIIEHIHRFAGQAVNVMLAPVDCVAARWIHRTRHRLGVSVIPIPDTDTLERFDNKWRFYEFCIATGLRTPSTRYVADKYQLDFMSMAEALGLPFIVKPVNEQASAGTCVVSSKEEYRHHILDNEAYRYAPLIVQRYIAGKDVGLNLLAINGQLNALAIQRRVDPTHDGSRVDFFANAELEHVAAIIAQQSRYTGVMNIDARIEEETGTLYLIESNPRFWRSLSASVWCGLNFLERCIARIPGVDIEKLTAGSADTYYHPLFRPALWWYALFDQTHRGRLVRVMLPDICTFTMSARILSARAKISARRLVSKAIHHLNVVRSLWQISTGGSRKFPAGSNFDGKP